MPLSAIQDKNPAKVAAGRAGARARWGPEPRIVRIDQLTPDQRRLVLALVEAAKKAAPSTNGTAQKENADVSGDHPAASS